MSKDELIEALQDHMGVMYEWMLDISDERIEGDGSRAEYAADLERARELQNMEHDE